MEPSGGSEVEMRSWGQSFQDGISVLIRRDRKEFASLSITWGDQEEALIRPRLHSTLEAARPPGLWEMNVYCLRHTVCGTFAIVAWIETPGFLGFTFPKVCSLCQKKNIWLIFSNGPLSDIIYLNFRSGVMIKKVILNSMLPLGFNCY